MFSDRYAQHSFAQVPAANMTRSSFDRSRSLKTTFAFDKLTPILIDEILPGDTMNVTANTFGRLATQVVPLMDNLYLDFFFFFVPNRLVWQNWEKFNGAQDNPGDSTSFIVPTLAAFSGQNTVGTVFDHMGIPPNLNFASGKINALPFRGHNLIWNEWFRDQNLQNSITVPIDDGPDPVTDYALWYRGKRHDYFTSCLPWPQKGTAVSLPLGTTAPVYGNTISTTASTAMGIQIMQGGVPVASRANASNTAAVVATATPTSGQNTFNIASKGASVNSNVYADLSTATAATINDLRQAWQIQSLLELDARGGTRYVEILLAHFNVVSPDFRLQRPEYLGGGSTRISSHPVAQTSAANASGTTTPQANLASFGTASTIGQNIGFTKSFVEHGFVFGYVAARADLTYQQGLNRMWSRQTRYDYFWPKLQELGEQTVLNKEIYAQATSNDELVFGYQERYAEYRYAPSEIHGEFRSQFSTPLDMWHMAQYFSSLPALNSSFIQSSTPISRNLAANDPWWNTASSQVLLDVWFKVNHARPMLTYSVPSTIGRF